MADLLVTADSDANDYFESSSRRCAVIGRCSTTASLPILDLLSMDRYWLEPQKPPGLCMDCVASNSRSREAFGFGRSKVLMRVKPSGVVVCLSAIVMSRVVRVNKC